MTASDQLKRLRDVARIRDLKGRYCLYLDTKRWDAWRILFTEDVRVHGINQAEGASREDFVNGVAESLAAVQTAHQVHEPLIELGTDGTARAVWPMFDDLRFPDGHPRAQGFARRVGYGHYEEEYRKEEGLWRISLMRVARLFVWRAEDHVPVSGGIPSAGTDWLSAERGGC